MRRALSALAFAGMWLAPSLSLAAPGGPAPSAGAGAGGPDELLTRPLSLVVALALVSLLPFLFMSTTAFVKIATTLQIVRSALGAPGVPSNTVITALAAALAILAMSPVASEIARRAGPLLEGPRAADTSVLVPGLIEAMREPARGFLRANASAREKARFLEVARRAREGTLEAPAQQSDLVVLVPAFMVTELYEAFALGFALYLPFLVIDLVVANVLLALGMQQLQPTQVSLPFKLLLFVAIDGWGMLAQSLVSGYHAG